MSLAGQWTTKYSGTNSGKLVVDIDEVGPGYWGTACLWDDAPQRPCSLAKFATATKDTRHEIKNISVTAIDQRGNAFDAAAMADLATKGLIFPKTADVEFELKGGDLHIAWKTGVGSSGGGTAVSPKTRGALRSALVPSRVNNWQGFKRYVSSLPPKRFIFRGHESAMWRLRSSFYRAGRANLDRYLTEDIAQLQKQLGAHTRHIYDLNNPLHYGAFVNLAQHHGYPTPLLDWTWSPYVAVFFAYRNIPKRTKYRRGAKIRICQFDVLAWNQIPQFDKLFPIQPHMSVLDAVAFDNSRVIPQQGISTISNVDDLETYIAEVERARGHTYLSVIDLPISQRDIVMQELALMGITAGSLFPGLDGACEALRERNF
jgi:hypothetical protein